MRKFLTLLLAALSLTSCHSEGSRHTVIRPVRTLEIHAKALSGDRVFAGLTKAGVEARLSFRVSGSIEELAVKVGDRVRTGDLIARLDPYDFELQLQQAEAALLQAEAQERQAASNFSRIRDLYETESSSRSDLDAARAAAESALAALQASSKQRDLAQAQLEYTTLRAPMDGGIASVDAEINENTARGQPIVLLTSDTHLEVQVTIPEALIAQIQEGDPVEVAFDAHSDKKRHPAIVTEVGVASRIGTSFPVTVQLLHKLPDIRSGMAAEVFFELSHKNSRSALYVPSLAVVEDQGSHYLFVVTAENPTFGHVRRVKISTGQLTNHGLEITKGLKEGDIIVTAGVQFLHDGQQVRLGR